LFYIAVKVELNEEETLLIIRRLHKVRSTTGPEERDCHAMLNVLRACLSLLSHCILQMNKVYFENKRQKLHWFCPC
jgi:hypothetical protein